MPLNRNYWWPGALCLALLMAVPALGQDLRGMQLFAPTEVTPYGNGPQPKEGYFFVFDGLSWSIATPRVAVIGNTTQGSRIVYNVGDGDNGWTQTNTHDTGELIASRISGNRIEFGRIIENHGWMFGVYRLNTQTQQIVASDAGIVFSDDDTWGVPSGGRLEGPVVMIPDPADPDADPIKGPSVNLPVVFDDLYITNRVQNWNVELMHVTRFRPFHHGGHMECFVGVRYLQFDDVFGVSGKVRTDGDIAQEDRARDILANSFWDTAAENHIIGPQIGVKIFKQKGRWIFSGEGRFLAGYNSQNLRQRGTFGTELLTPAEDRDLGEPAQMLATDFNHVAHLHEWSPTVEVRLQGKYQFARSVSLRVGWTGVWMDGIARASDLVDYSLTKDSVMGLLTANNEQGVLIHGFTIGLDVNR